jgi:hypothetical protein
MCIITSFVGSTYVYGSVGNIWSRQSKLLAADGSGGDWFGYSVSIYDTSAMIGAYKDDDKATDAGKALTEIIGYIKYLHYIMLHLHFIVHCAFRKCVCLWICGKYLVSSI